MSLVFVTDVFDAPLARGGLLILMLFLALSVGERRYGVLAVLVAPVLVLLSSHAAAHEPPIDYLRTALVAFVPVVVASGLGHWVFWTLRDSSRRVTV